MTDQLLTYAMLFGCLLTNVMLAANQWWFLKYVDKEFWPAIQELNKKIDRHDKRIAANYDETRDSLLGANERLTGIFQSHTLAIAKLEQAVKKPKAKPRRRR